MAVTKGIGNLDESIILVALSSDDADKWKYSTTELNMLMESGKFKLVKRSIKESICHCRSQRQVFGQFGRRALMRVLCACSAGATVCALANPY